jgi:hypothetical protein
LLKRIALIVLGLAVVIQLIPYGRDHSNPPVTAEPKWNSPDTRATFQRACGNCHSHETVWPWYSHVAPVSWLVQRDVDHARSEFNVSLPNGTREGDEAAEMVLEHKMPPSIYLPTHPEARLSDEERKVFAIGLDATFGPGRNREGEEAGVGEKSGYLD